MTTSTRTSSTVKGEKQLVILRRGSGWVKVNRKPGGCWECPDWKHMLVSWISTQRFCSVLAQCSLWHIIHQLQETCSKIKSRVCKGRLVGWTQWQQLLFSVTVCWISQTLFRSPLLHVRTVVTEETAERKTNQGTTFEVCDYGYKFYT